MNTLYCVISYCQIVSYFPSLRAPQVCGCPCVPEDSRGPSISMITMTMTITIMFSNSHSKSTYHSNSNSNNNVIM